MTIELDHIQFKNQNNPQSGFDLLSLQDLFSRSDLDTPIDTLHLVEFYIIIFIQDGFGKHTIDFTEYDCQKGTILTIRKGQIHRFHISSTLNGVMLLFTDDFLVSYLEHLEAQRTLQLFNEQLSQPNLTITSDNYIDIEEIINKISLEYHSVQDYYSLGIIRSRLHIFLTLLFRIKYKSHNTLQNRKYLNEFIDFQNLVELHVKKTRKVLDYSKMLGISTKTLNTISKAIVNESAKNFIDDIGVKQIKRLLINTDLQINEIAYESGFDDTTNFYKYFKRLVKITPEQFRSSV